MELSKAKSALYASLSQVKFRRRHGLFIVEGEKAVRDTIGFFEPEAIVCTDGYNVTWEVTGDVSYYTVSQAQMKKISGLATPSPVLGVFHIPSGRERVISGLEKKLHVVLDGIQDPGNLGTIVRTCHWFGIYTIFASRDTVDIYNPKCVQATMGSLGKVEVIYTDLHDLFSANPSLPVYGMLLEGEDIFKATLSKSGFIVLGNEGKGISGKLRELVTHPLLIPPGGPDHSESLNVAVAGAIAISCFIGR